MLYALIGIERTEAAPGLTASCPCCGGAMIAKCGPQRVFHWAHATKTRCDGSSEPETAWHSGWKGKFHSTWREVISCGKAGEKRIADVRTEHGMTIEFQHSYLKIDERAARERYYENVVWVVDGARLGRDFKRFVKGRRSFQRLKAPGYYLCPFPNEVFPANWLDCTVPVFFDFQLASAITYEEMQARGSLWCLLPGRAICSAVVLEISLPSFIDWACSTLRPIQSQAIVEAVAHMLLEKQKRRAQIAAAQIATRSETGWRRHPRRYARF